MACRRVKPPSAAGGSREARLLHVSLLLKHPVSKTPKQGGATPRPGRMTETGARKLGASLETSCFKDPETGGCRTTAWAFVGARCLRAKESDAHAALSKFRENIRPQQRAPTLTRGGPVANGPSSLCRRARTNWFPRTPAGRRFRSATAPCPGRTFSPDNGVSRPAGS